MSIRYYAILISADNPDDREDVCQYMADRIAADVRGGTAVSAIHHLLRDTIISPTYDYDFRPAGFILKLDRAGPTLTYTGWNEWFPLRSEAELMAQMRAWYGLRIQADAWYLCSRRDVDDFFTYCGITMTPKPCSRETFYGIHPVKSKRKIAVAPLP